MRMDWRNWQISPLVSWWPLQRDRKRRKWNEIVYMIWYLKNMNIRTMQSYLLDAITGSSTTFLSRYSFIIPAITSIISLLPVSPIFTASIRVSSHTARIWDSTNHGELSSTCRTPWVFWTVTAVMQEVANTSKMVAVLISACWPAPPQESLPEMARRVGMGVNEGRWWWWWW